MSPHRIACCTNCGRDTTRRSQLCRHCTSGPDLERELEMDDEIQNSVVFVAGTGYRFRDLTNDAVSRDPEVLNNLLDAMAMGQ